MEVGNTRNYNNQKANQKTYLDHLHLQLCRIEAYNMQNLESQNSTGGREDHDDLIRAHAVSSFAWFQFFSSGMQHE